MPAADWTPGVPVDSRTPARIQRAQTSVYGDFEHSAARVVARLTGERVELIDDGRVDATPDLLLTRHDGSSAFVEVVLDADPATAALANHVRRRQHTIEAPGLRRTWWLYLTPPADLREVELRAPALLATLEAGAYFVPSLTDVGFLVDAPPALAELAALGIAELASGARASAGESTIWLIGPGTGGNAEQGWEGFLAAVERLVRSPALSDVRSKLMQSGAAERHAFIGATEASDWTLNYWLSSDLVSVPDRPPCLQEEITHLWLWGRVPFGRVLHWSPERGWLDTRAHWKTG